MKERFGLTKKDVVVILGCAIFLLMNLGAVSNRGRRRAQQMVCGSQLGKWGQAIFMHSADNGDMVMSIVRRWGEVPYPHYMSSVYDYSTIPYNAEEWNLYAINPYLGAFSETFASDGVATRLVACPSCDADFMKAWIYSNWSNFPNHFIEPTYSYWGRADLLENDNDYSPNAKRDLTGATFSGDRLLMSEIINIYDAGGWNGLRYNHGLTGWSWGMGWAASAPAPGHDKFDGQQDATGRNQLFGDGRVQWRPISLEFEDNLPSAITELGGVGFYENEWNGAGSGWVNRYDVSYY